MILKEDFMTEFDGHCNAYSSYMVIGVKLKDLLKALNEINPELCVGSGRLGKNSISFEISGELPSLINDITAKLHCKGFADIDSWYGAGYFEASYDGKEYNDYTAKWEDGSPERRDYDYPDYDYDSEDSNPDVDMDWDAFVLITDNESGENFCTGEGAIDYEQLQYWTEVVKTHHKNSK